MLVAIVYREHCIVGEFLMGWKRKVGDTDSKVIAVPFDMEGLLLKFCQIIMKWSLDEIFPARKSLQSLCNVGVTYQAYQQRHLIILHMDLCFSRMVPRIKVEAESDVRLFRG